MRKRILIMVLLLLVICTGCGDPGDKAADTRPATSPTGAALPSDTSDPCPPVSEKAYVLSQSPVNQYQIRIDYTTGDLALVKDGAAYPLPDSLYQSLRGMLEESDPYSYSCDATYAIQWFSDERKVYIADYILDTGTLDCTEIDDCVLFRVSGDTGIFLADGQLLISAFDGGLVGHIAVAKKLCRYAGGSIETLYTADEGRYLFVENYAQGSGDLKPADGGIRIRTGAGGSIETLEAEIKSNGAGFLQDEHASLLSTYYETEEEQDQALSDAKQYIEGKYPFAIDGISDGAVMYRVTLGFFMDQIEEISIGVY